MHHLTTSNTFWTNWNYNIILDVKVFERCYWKGVKRSFDLCYYCVGHYDDVIMGAVSSQITSLTMVYSIVYSGTDQRKHQSSASLASVQGIHRGPVNSAHKGPVTRKVFPFDDVITIGVFWIPMTTTISPHHISYSSRRNESDKVNVIDSKSRNVPLSLMK